METWFSIQELLGLKSLPSSDRGIMKKADRENLRKIFTALLYKLIKKN